MRLAASICPSARTTRSYRCFQLATKSATPSNGEDLHVHQDLVELHIREIVKTSSRVVTRKFAKFRATISSSSQAPRDLD